jgi:diguanylate cyclase (GGDEF)-like protein
MIVFHLADGTSVTLKHDPLRADSLAHDVVYGSFQDRGGLIWVATNGGGVSRYNPRRQQFQFEPASGKVLALHETASGSLWAGVYNGGLVEYNPQGKIRTWKHDPKDPRSLSNDIINGITEDPQHRLWLLTNQGVTILDPVTGRLTRWDTDPGHGDSLPDEVVNSLVVDRTGTYWFGTYRSGVIRRPPPGTPGPVHVYTANSHLPGALPDNLVYFVQEDREGRIWVGTNGGLALYRPETDDFQVWRYDPADPRTLPSNTVRCLLEDSRGRFWVATNGGGLSRLDPATGALENFGLKDGLSNLSIYTVLEDGNGRLWTASANGLFSFDPDQKVFRRYGKADGLMAPEFSAGYLKTADGRMLFGGLKGILTLRPGNLVTSDPPPPVALTAIQVLGSPRQVAPKLSLGWQENAVTFSFAALDFRNPGKNLYAYRLEGFDRDWVQAGTRHEATYTNLWPGTYRFRFRGANPSEAWAESDQSVELTVQAAPWADWYAWIVYAGVFLTMVYLYQRARVSRTLGQKVSELEVLRTQLEEANRKLDQLARLDGLTGIPNRRALDEWLAGEGARALRQRQSVSLLMIDIDDFKRYNDFYGHLEGDTCLKVVAKTLSESLLRTTDFVARYGGEEFVVVLHDTDLEGARIVAERLKDAIDALAIPHQMASAVKHVSISLGVASQVPGADRTIEDLLQAADQALYRAKALGRHRVETS